MRWRLKSAFGDVQRTWYRGRAMVGHLRRSRVKSNRSTWRLMGSVVAACAIAFGGACGDSRSDDVAAESEAPIVKSAPTVPMYDSQLYRAAERGNRTVVGERVRAGADLNAPNPAQGWTPLHAAAYNGHKKLVAYMLTNGANANAQDADGNTPLHLAAGRGHADTTAALMGASDLSVRNHAGKTARDVASPSVLVYFPRA